MINYGDPAYVTVKARFERLMEYNPDKWEITDSAEKRVHLDQNEEVKVQFNNLMYYDVNVAGGDEIEFYIEVIKEEPD